VNINIEEDSMSSLDAYMNPSSLWQMAVFKYKPCTLWPRNYRCPVMFEEENRRWMGNGKTTNLHVEGLLGIWCLPAAKPDLWTMPWCPADLVPGLYL